LHLQITFFVSTRLKTKFSELSGNKNKEGAGLHFSIFSKGS